MKGQLQQPGKGHTVSNPVPDDFTSANAVWDWIDLTPGDFVHVRTDTGVISRAVVDTLTDDGTMVWLRNDPMGYRSLHLITDPLTLYKQ
jgi:hypothetical protein